MVSIERKKYDNSKRTLYSKTKQIIESIKNSISNNPLITNQKLREIIKEVFNITISSGLVRIAIKRLGLTRKKARFYGMPKNLKDVTSTFIIQRGKFINEGRLFFSLDETSFGRHGKPVYGYCLKGKQLHIAKKQAMIITTSMLAVVSRQGFVKTQFQKGSFNSLLFFDFMKLLDLPKKSVILLDNVRFHHCKIIKQLAIEKEWSLLYVPPYSPWMNPIEGVFSIVKRAFYKDCSINESIMKVTASHCEGFFRHSLSHQGFC